MCVFWLCNTPRTACRNRTRRPPVQTVRCLWRQRARQASQKSECEPRLSRTRRYRSHRHRESVRARTPRPDSFRSPFHFSRLFPLLRRTPRLCLRRGHPDTVRNRRFPSRCGCIHCRAPARNGCRTPRLELLGDKNSSLRNLPKLLDSSSDLGHER